MLAVAQFDQRSIECAASQIVDQEPAPAAALAVHQVAVGKFNRCRRGFVQQSENFEPRLASGFGGKKTLIAVGIRRHAQHGFQRLVAIARQRKVECSRSCARKAAIISRSSCRTSKVWPPISIRVSGPASFKQRFSERIDCPARLPLPQPCVPSVKAPVSTHGDEGRKPLTGVPIRSFEVDERIVAAVHGRSHNRVVPKSMPTFTDERTPF